MNGAYTKARIPANRTSLYGIQQGNYFLKVEIYCTKVEGKSVLKSFLINKGKCAKNVLHA